MAIRYVATALLFSLPGVLFGATPIVTCPAGSPIGNIDLRVGSPHGGDPLPLKTINHLNEGDEILYRPLLRSNEKRKGEVTLVFVPAIHEPHADPLLVLEPKDAGKPETWKVPAKISVVALVYGPDGLNRKKVKKFLSKDEEVVGQLADYAEKTAQTEALIGALSSGNSSTTVDAAMQGFASQYGLSNKLDRTAPPDQQMLVMLRALNPTVASYDPLASSSSQVLNQTAGLATSVAAMFFGSTVGLAAGGTAMLMELHALAFPGVAFRSSFAQELPKDGLALCAKKDAIPAHTRVAFLWAARIPNAGPPFLTVGKESTLPLNLKSTLPVTVSDAGWKNVDRARKWMIEGPDRKAKEVKVQKAADNSLAIDLSSVYLKPGKYRLAAYWDWERFTVKGDVLLQPLSKFTSVKIEPDSQDKLIADSGKIPVTLKGDDFEFITKVEMKHLHDEFASPADLRFVLPKGLRQGPQNTLDVQVDTSGLTPGEYEMLLQQPGGGSHGINVKILPSPPKIVNLPMTLHSGDDWQEVTLKGQHLDRLAKLESPRAQLNLEPASEGPDERPVTIRLASNVLPGATLDLKAFFQDHAEPVNLGGAIRVAGPRPEIVGVKIEAPSGMAVALNAGELPAASYLSATLQGRNIEPTSSVKFDCDADGAPQGSVRIGGQSSSASLQQVSSDILFLSFDTTGWPNGCTVRAKIDNGAGRVSNSYELGHIVRLPQIETFKLTDESAGPGLFVGVLTGTNLETIAKTGWDAEHGSPIMGLPAPIAGSGQKQSLKIEMPWPAPSPHAPLYVWFRGDTQGRATTVRY